MHECCDDFGSFGQRGKDSSGLPGAPGLLDLSFAPGARIPDAPARLVPNPFKTETLRRGGEARASTIFCSQNIRHLVWCEAALADIHQGASHDPYLVHEKTVSLENEGHSGPSLFHSHCVDDPHGALRDALFVAETGEVLLSHKGAGGQGHGFAIQGDGALDMPAAAMGEWILGRPFLDAIDVSFGNRMLSGEKAFWGRLGTHHPHVTWQVGIGGGQQAEGIPRTGQVRQNPLGLGMHSRISAPRSLGHRGVGIEAPQGVP